MAEKELSVAFFSNLHLYSEDEIKGVEYIITGGAGAPLHEKVTFGEHNHDFVAVRVRNGKISAEVIRIHFDIQKAAEQMR